MESSTQAGNPCCLRKLPNHDPVIQSEKDTASSLPPQFLSAHSCLELLPLLPSVMGWIWKYMSIIIFCPKLVLVMIFDIATKMNLEQFPFKRTEYQTRNAVVFLFVYLFIFPSCVLLLSQGGSMEKLLANEGLSAT